MSADKNGANSRVGRHFSPQQKVDIVKRHLEDCVPISDMGTRN
jgi:hypothetical protein